MSELLYLALGPIVGVICAVTAFALAFAVGSAVFCLFNRNGGYP